MGSLRWSSCSYLFVHLCTKRLFTRRLSSFRTVPYSQVHLNLLSYLFFPMTFSSVDYAKKKKKKQREVWKLNWTSSDIRHQLPASSASSSSSVTSTAFSLSCLISSFSNRFLSVVIRYSRSSISFLISSSLSELNFFGL